MAVLIIISLLFILSILYIFYSVKEAKVYDEEFDKEAFSKPEGWKVGKLPKNFKIRKEAGVRRSNSHNSACVLESLIESLSAKELSKESKTDFSD